MVLTIGKFTCIMGERMQFAPTITGHPNKIGFTGKIYPEHLVLKQDLLDFEDYIQTHINPFLGRVNLPPILVPD